MIDCERVRFWCAFQIRRLGDEALIAECRQMLAIIQMPEAKLLRLPEEWGRFRAPEPEVAQQLIGAAATFLRET